MNVDSDYPVLEIGAGKKPLLPGATTADLRPENDPDIVLDMEQENWSIPGDTFAEVYLHHSLEHVDNWSNALREIHRIVKPAGSVHIWIPHASLSVYHPDHNTHFSRGSFSKHCDPENQEYVGAEFLVETERMHWKNREKKPAGNSVLQHRRRTVAGALGAVIDTVFNRFNVPDRYAPLVGGFDEMYVHLRAVGKDADRCGSCGGEFETYRRVFVDSSGSICRELCRDCAEEMAR